MNVLFDRRPDHPLRDRYDLGGIAMRGKTSGLRLTRHERRHPTRPPEGWKPKHKGHVPPGTLLTWQPVKAMLDHLGIDNVTDRESMDPATRGSHGPAFYREHGGTPYKAWTGYHRAVG